MDTDALEDRLKKLKGKVLESYLLYGSGLTNTFVANSENMTLGILEKVVNECDNQEYYHKFVIYDIEDDFNRHFILKTVLDFLHPTVLIPVYFRKQSDKCFFLAKNCHEALMKVIANRFKIPHPQNLDIFIKIEIFCNFLTISTVDFQQIGNLNAVLQSRFNESKKILNLSHLIEDDSLDHYCPLYLSKVMLNVMSIVSGYLPMYLSLRGNLLKDINSIYPLNKVELEWLDLSHNEISNIEDLECLQYFVNLKSLILDGNPICAKYDRYTYISAITDICKSLEKLDNMKLSNPPQFQKNFMCKLEAKDFASQFLSHFFTVYDLDDRQPLKELYDKEAIFSVSSRMIPQQSNSDTVNLIHYGFNEPFLVCGVKKIMKVFDGFPKTYHDPYTFVCDVLIYEDTYVALSIGGMFREEQKIMTFTRNFIIKNDNNEYLITNDQLLVQNATNIQLTWCFRFPTPNSYFPYFSDQYKTVEDIMQDLTKMNRTYCQRYLNLCQYDLKKALQIFSELHVVGAIPEEAFGDDDASIAEDTLPFNEQIREKTMELYEEVTAKTVWDTFYRERMEKWPEPKKTSHRQISKIYHFLSTELDGVSIPVLTKETTSNLKKAVTAKRDSEEAHKSIRFNIPSIFKGNQGDTSDTSTKLVATASVPLANIPLPQTGFSTGKAYVPPSTIATPQTSTKTIKPVIIKADVRPSTIVTPQTPSRSAKTIKPVIITEKYANAKNQDGLKKQKSEKRKSANNMPTTSTLAKGTSTTVAQTNSVVSQRSLVVPQEVPTLSQNSLSHSKSTLIQQPTVPNVPSDRGIFESPVHASFILQSQQQSVLYHNQLSAFDALLPNQSFTDTNTGNQFGYYQQQFSEHTMFQQESLLGMPPEFQPAVGSNTMFKPPPAVGITLTFTQPPPAVGITSKFTQLPPAVGSASVFKQPPPPVGSSSVFTQPPPAVGSASVFTQPPPAVGSASVFTQPPPAVGSTSVFTQPPPAVGSTSMFVEDNYYPCPLTIEEVKLPVPPGEEATNSADKEKKLAVTDSSETGEKRKAIEAPKDAPEAKQTKLVRTVNELHPIEQIFYSIVMDIMKMQFVKWEPIEPVKNVLIEYVEKIYAFADLLDFIGRKTGSRNIPESHTMFYKRNFDTFQKHENIIQNIAHGIVHVIRHDMFEHTKCNWKPEISSKAEDLLGSNYKIPICRDMIYLRGSAQLLSRIRKDLFEKIQKEFKFIKFSDSMIEEIKNPEKKSKQDEKEKPEEKPKQDEKEKSEEKPEQDEKEEQRDIPSLISVSGSELLFRKLIVEIAGNTIATYTPLSKEGSFIADIANRMMLHFKEMAINGYTACSKDLSIDAVVSGSRAREFLKKLVSRIARGIVHVLVHEYLLMSKCGNILNIPLGKGGICNDTIYKPNNKPWLVKTQLAVANLEFNLKCQIQRKNVEKSAGPENPTKKKASTLDDYTKALWHVLMGVLYEKEVVYKPFIPLDKNKCIAGMSRTLASFIRHLDNKFQGKVNTVYLNSLIRMVQNELANKKNMDIVEICISIMHVIVHDWFEHNYCKGVVQEKKGSVTTPSNPKLGALGDLLCDNDVYTDKCLLQTINNHLITAECNFVNLCHKSKKELKGLDIQITTEGPVVVESIQKANYTASSSKPSTSISKEVISIPKPSTSKSKDFISFPKQVTKPPQWITITQKSVPNAPKYMIPTSEQVTFDPNSWDAEQLPYFDKCRNVVFFIPFVQNYENLSYDVLKELIISTAQYNRTRTSVSIDRTLDGLVKALIKGIRCLTGKEKFDYSFIEQAHTKDTSDVDFTKDIVEVDISMKPEIREISVKLVRSDEITKKINEILDQESNLNQRIEDDNVTVQSDQEMKSENEERFKTEPAKNETDAINQKSKEKVKIDNAGTKAQASELTVEQEFEKNQTDASKDDSMEVASDTIIPEPTKEGTSSGDANKAITGNDESLKTGVSAAIDGKSNEDQAITQTSGDSSTSIKDTEKTEVKEMVDLTEVDVETVAENSKGKVKIKISSFKKLTDMGVIVTSDESVTVKTTSEEANEETKEQNSDYKKDTPAIGDDTISEGIDLTESDSVTEAARSKIKLNIKIPPFEKRPLKGLKIAKALESSGTKSPLEEATTSRHEEKETTSSDGNIERTVEVAITKPVLQEANTSGQATHSNVNIAKTVEATITKPVWQEAATSGQEDVQVTCSNVNKEKTVNKEQNLDNSSTKFEAKDNKSGESSQNIAGEVKLPQTLPFSQVEYVFKMIGLDPGILGYKPKKFLTRTFLNVIHVINHELIENSECHNMKEDKMAYLCNSLSNTLCFVSSVYHPKSQSTLFVIRKAIHECDSTIRRKIMEEKDLSKFSDLRELKSDFDEREVLINIFNNLMGKLLESSSKDPMYLEVKWEIIQVMVDFVITKFYKRNIQLNSQPEILFQPNKQMIMCKRNGKELKFGTAPILLLRKFGHGILHLMHHEMYLHLPCQTCEFWLLDPGNICRDSIYIKGLTEERSKIRYYLKEVEDQFINLKFQDHPTLEEYEAIADLAKYRTLQNYEIPPDADEGLTSSVQELKKVIQKNALRDLFYTILGKLVRDSSKPMFVAIKREILEVMAEYVMTKFYKIDMKCESQQDILFDRTRKPIVCKRDGTTLLFKNAGSPTFLLRKCGTAILHIMYHEMFLHSPCVYKTVLWGDQGEICYDDVYRNWPFGMRNKIRLVLKDVENRFINLKFIDPVEKYEHDLSAKLPENTTKSVSDPDITSERELLSSMFTDVIKEVCLTDQKSSPMFWKLHRELIEVMVDFVLIEFYKRDIICNSQPELLYSHKKEPKICNRDGTVIDFRRLPLRTFRKTANGILHVMYHEMFLHSPCPFDTETYPSPEHICANSIYRNRCLKNAKLVNKIRAALKKWDGKLDGIKFVPTEKYPLNTSIPESRKTPTVTATSSNAPTTKVDGGRLSGVAPLSYLQEIGDGNFYMRIIRDVVLSLRGKRFVNYLPKMSVREQAGQIVADYVKGLGTGHVQEVKNVSTTSSFYDRIGLGCIRKLEKSQQAQCMDFFKIAKGLIHLITHEFYENSVCKRKTPSFSREEFPEICWDNLYITKNKNLLRILRDTLKYYLLRSREVPETPVTINDETEGLSSDKPIVQKRKLEESKPESTSKDMSARLISETLKHRPSQPKEVAETPVIIDNETENLSCDKPKVKRQKPGESKPESLSKDASARLISETLKHYPSQTKEVAETPHIIIDNETENLSCDKPKVKRQKLGESKPESSSKDTSARLISETLKHRPSQPKEVAETPIIIIDGETENLSTDKPTVKKLKVEKSKPQSSSKDTAARLISENVKHLSQPREVAKTSISINDQTESLVIDKSKVKKQKLEKLKQESSSKDKAVRIKDRTSANIRKELNSKSHISKETSNIDTEKLKMEARKLVDQGKFATVIQAYQRLVKDCFKEQMQQKVLPKLTVKLEQMNLEHIQTKTNTEIKQKINPTHKLKVVLKKKPSRLPKSSDSQGSSKKNEPSVTIGNDLTNTQKTILVEEMDVEKKSEENDMIKDYDSSKKIEQVDLKSICAAGLEDNKAPGVRENSPSDAKPQKQMILDVSEESDKIIEQLKVSEADLGMIEDPPSHKFEEQKSVQDVPIESDKKVEQVELTNISEAALEEKTITGVKENPLSSAKHKEQIDVSEKSAEIIEQLEASEAGLSMSENPPSHTKLKEQMSVVPIESDKKVKQVELTNISEAALEKKTITGVKEIPLSDTKLETQMIVGDTYIESAKEVEQVPERGLGEKSISGTKDDTLSDAKLEEQMAVEDESVENDKKVESTSVSKTSLEEKNSSSDDKLGEMVVEDVSIEEAMADLEDILERKDVMPSTLFEEKIESKPADNTEEQKNDPEELLEPKLSKVQTKDFFEKILEDEPPSVSTKGVQSKPSGNLNDEKIDANDEDTNITFSMEQEKKKQNMELQVESKLSDISKEELEPCILKEKMDTEDKSQECKFSMEPNLEDFKEKLEETPEDIQKGELEKLEKVPEQSSLTSLEKQPDVRSRSGGKTINTDSMEETSRSVQIEMDSNKEIEKEILPSIEFTKRDSEITLDSEANGTEGIQEAVSLETGEIRDDDRKELEGMEVEEKIDDKKESEAMEIKENPFSSNASEPDGDNFKINLEDFDLFLLSSPEPEIRDSVSEIKPDFGPDSEDEDKESPEPSEEITGANSPEPEVRDSMSDIQPDFGPDSENIDKESPAGVNSPESEVRDSVSEIKPDFGPDSEDKELPEPSGVEGITGVSSPELEVQDSMSGIKPDFGPDLENEDKKSLAEVISPEPDVRDLISEIKLDFGPDSGNEDKESQGPSEGVVEIRVSTPEPEVQASVSNINPDFGPDSENEDKESSERVVEISKCDE